jgi:hypothetical protein
MRKCKPVLSHVIEMTIPIYLAQKTDLYTHLALLKTLDTS